MVTVRQIKKNAKRSIEGGVGGEDQQENIRSTSE
jgi:hypothetical protein